jgi:CubicO group peptidase (beta-lactamase class C family)
VTSGFIADELIRRLTGMTIIEYLEEKIAKPMGMKHFTYGLDEAGREEVALNYITGMRNGKIIGGILEKVLGVSIEDAAELSNSEGFMTMPVPSANLYTTAEEISRFYQMLLDDGDYQGQSIFSKTSIQTATREAGKARFDKAIKLPMRFSAGFMLGGSPIGMYGLNTHEAYGHLGFSNIFCWADPTRDISVAFLSTGKPILGNHVLALPKLMHTISSITEIK